MNSQTACAEVSLRILGIGEGDEVIVLAYTYTATASVVCHVGANVIMLDCQNGSLEMDYDALEAAITEKTWQSCDCSRCGSRFRRRMAR